MSSVLDGIAVVLLDIEGTTTPMPFVHERLFPYARARLDGFLQANWDAPGVQAVVASLADEYRGDRGSPDLPDWIERPPNALRASLSRYAIWLMDRDRKSPGLKALQGLIWESAYATGELHGEVFDDVPRAMKRWHDAGLRVAIYSSGSELAQRLLFASTRHGDLTPLIAAFFDTAVGPKIAPDSYRRIAVALGCATDEILFLSDAVTELSAAAAADCPVMLCIRPGNAPQSAADQFPQVGSFDAI